jgi:predicted nucleotide-binding protein (sugar kinase/HSP70/actin superfamily)
MNQNILMRLEKKAEKLVLDIPASLDCDEYTPLFNEKFAELIVYDFLSELTNDDSLGEARIRTIRRLAEKWGVAK